MKNSVRFHVLPLLTALFAYTFFGSAYLVRDLWFDEALTLMNFALVENPADIYFNYVIPNNQIVYTLLLRFWVELTPQWIDFGFWMRLLSFLLGGGTLMLLYFRFKERMGGSWVFLPALVALASAVPFLIYATAMRGYVLSAFLTVLTLDRGLEFARRGTVRTGFEYALCSLLLTGTIPSNLAVEVAIVLYLLPLFGNNFLRSRRFWITALIPPAMFALFYLPLLRQFIGVLQLGEGWNNGGRVLLALLAATAFSFPMLLIPATGALLAFDRKRYNWLWSARAAIWLVPIPIALLLPTAPFPRVFLPFWPIWTLLLAGGIRDLTALQCRLNRRWNPAVWIGALAVVVFFWGSVAQNPSLRQAFSRRNGGAGADDFFFGYYLRPEHTPQRTIQAIHTCFGVSRPIYMSFSADPWALMFYGRLAGMENFLFDGPRGRVAALEPGTLIVLRSDEEPELLEQRFLKTLRFCFRNANHAVYQVE